MIQPLTRIWLSNSLYYRTAPVNASRLRWQVSQAVTRSRLTAASIPVSIVEQQGLPIHTSLWRLLARDRQHNVTPFLRL